MGALRGPDGKVIYVPEDRVGAALANGYTAVSSNEAGDSQAAIAPEDTGVVGGINAAATGALSGLTLGLSDVALKSMLTKGQGERLSQDREAHPWISGASQVAGAVLPALVDPASLLAHSPAGYLSRAAASGVEAGRATGGALGIAQSLAATGLEGAVQNAGVYLSDTALGDRDLTAEGMAGALGTGFEFGAAGGAVAHGIEAGTIAARRMFARVAEGGDKAAQLAEEAWTQKSQEILTANDQTADIARAKLAEARAAREQASLLRDRAVANLADARVAAPEIDAARARATKLDESIGKIEAGEPAAKPFGDDTAALRRLIDRGALAVDEAKLAPLVDEYVAARKEFDAVQAQVEAPISERKQAVQDWIKGARSKDTGYYERAPLGEGDARLPRGRESVFRGTAAERDAADTAMLDKYAESRTLKQHIADGDIKVRMGPSTTAADIEEISALQAQERATVRRSLGERATVDTPMVPTETPKNTRQLGVGRGGVTLEDQLAEMQQRLSGGESLQDLRAHPMSPRNLEMAHDAALDRAASAPDLVARQQSLQEAAAIEKQISAVGAAPGAVEDVAAVAESMTRLEKAAASMTEAVGDAAPKAARDAADAYRAAESAAERKTMARTSRAVDHAVETPVELGPDGQPLQVGADRRPGATSKASIAAAKTEKLAADAHLARARAVETEASIGSRAAGKSAKDARAAVDAITAAAPDVVPVATGKSKFLSTLKTTGTVLEAAGSMGLPGIPKPSDLPVVGPLLGAYLKYRALKAVAGRFVGRIPATAETKAASMAATIKDKIARAVDRSLGLIERSAPVVRAGTVAASVRVGDALRRRAIDDGEPDAPKGATNQQLAAVRIREVANAATNPQLILALVRKETATIADPDLIASIENHQVTLYQHLNDTAPKAPPPNPYARVPWEPSAAMAMQWGRRFEVANDPVAAFEALHQQSLTPEAADTLRAVYPKLFAMAQQRLVERAGDLTQPVPYRQRLQNSLLFDVPLDASLDPESAHLLQSAHAASRATPPAAPVSPPVPSTAGSVNLSSLYQPGPDRRSQMR